jgi:hypothetical protein
LGIFCGVFIEGLRVLLKHFIKRVSGGCSYIFKNVLRECLGACGGHLVTLLRGLRGAIYGYDAVLKYRRFHGVLAEFSTRFELSFVQG